MPFPEPQHAGHVFLGYRGVSVKHYFIDPTKSIRYNPPPPQISGASQLGAGVYIVNNLRTAEDYAKDSAWNNYCNSFKSKKKDIDNENARKSFEKTIWKGWGRIHAVFMPKSKYESATSTIADFSHVNIDRTGEFIWDNMKNHYTKNKSRTCGIKTQLFDDIQIVIYPPHTQALYIKDITEEAEKYLAE